MKAARRLLGYRDFSSEPKIRKMIVKSRNFDSSVESTELALSLLIFETSKQRTWLVSTKLRLYCILDDLRNLEPKLQWSESKASLLKNNSYKDSLNIHSKTDNTGLLDVGERRRGWLFSKRLISENNIIDQVNSLLSRT